MRTLPWVAPAVLLASIVGCSQDSPTAKKTPAPNTAAPKPDATPAASANLVTLHVEGMV